MQGTILRVIRGKGFGFIVAENRQFFFHHSEVQNEAFKRLVAGDVVEFQPQEEAEGRNPRATSIIVVQKKERLPNRVPVARRPGPLRASRMLGRRSSAVSRRHRSADPEPMDIAPEDAADAEFIAGVQGTERPVATVRVRRGKGRGQRAATLGRRRATGVPGQRGEGVIRAIDVERGFGFIETSTGDIFFHRTCVRDSFDSLSIGARVAFVFGLGDRGSKAEDVAPL